MAEERRVCYDSDLKIEAYQFQGLMQKFPNHFHDHYVVGFIESGKRHLSCKNRDYILVSGDMLLLNPRENHECEQVDERALDFRCLNIPEAVMESVMEEITGSRRLPEFSEPVAPQAEEALLLREVHEMIMEGSGWSAATPSRPQAVPRRKTRASSGCAPLWTRTTPSRSPSTSWQRRRA